MVVPLLALFLAAGEPIPHPPVAARAHMRLLDAAKASERGWRDGKAERQRERIETVNGKPVLLRITEFE